MNLLKHIKTWGIWLALAGVLLLLPLRQSHAATSVPASVLPKLEQAATLRQEGKPQDAVKLLQQAQKDAGRDAEASAAVQYVLADTYAHDLKDTKQAMGLYSRLGMAHLSDKLTIPGYAQPIDVQEAALKYQDEQNQGSTLYKAMAAITHAIGDNPITGRTLAHHTGVIAILLLTIAIKVLLYPLTVTSFRSMRKMQDLQPEMKKLQAQYKDKPQELNKQVFDLYKRHGVNPMSGCLPMLLQMPIIILLWRAIGVYQYPLSFESFLWIPRLSSADTVLAVIYALSLLASSKLTMMPTADPQQEQQQKMMAYMMPIMFFWLFKGYSAGFILGWLFFNVLTTLQQWHIMRQHPAPALAGAAAGGGVVTSGSWIDRLLRPGVATVPVESAVDTSPAGGNGAKPAARENAGADEHVRKSKVRLNETSRTVRNRSGSGRSSGKRGSASPRGRR